MTIYVDSLFLLNFLLNYLLLLGSARIGGAPIDRRRMAAAAALGGLYAVGCVLPGTAFLRHMAAKAAVCVLMLLCAFGKKRGVLRLGALFLALSVAFCGVVIAMMELLGSGLMLLHGTAYYPVSAQSLLLTAAAVYILARMVFARITEHSGGDLVDVELNTGGRSVKLKALRDTGNTLKDPVTNRSVLVVDWQVAKALLPVEAAEGLSQAQFAQPAELLPRLSAKTAAVRWRLIPYRAVGTAGGLLLAMRCDRVMIGRQTVRGGLVAFSPTAVSDGGSYSALIGGGV